MTRSRSPALPVMFAIILHEVMHGVVAKMLGDDTASRAGRLTLNPIAHVDPFGTIILPAICCSQVHRYLAMRSRCRWITASFTIRAAA